MKKIKKIIEEYFIVIVVIVMMFSFLFQFAVLYNYSYDPFLKECKKLGFVDYYIDRGTIGNTTLTNIICTDTEFEHIIQIFVETQGYSDNKDWWLEKQFEKEIVYD